MTTLVHDAALLKVNVDTGRLFDGDFRYAQWLGMVIESVNETRRAIAEEERRQMKS